MAQRKASPATCSPIPIGNCYVTVESSSFACKSDSNNLQISISRKANIKVSVREELDSERDKDCALQLKPEDIVDEERLLTTGSDYNFIHVNSKDADGYSKGYLQGVLRIYAKELPEMKYAANTGKQSKFLERCVSNGKYCTLLLESKSTGGSGEVIAAITYQIVPADMRYAEVPLAAVSSVYQYKGLGFLLYMELRKRLQSVGVHTIYCWGDEDSQSFWIKQGFSPIAEVDRKGRARKLPIKANIRRALCFPGGSTLMVSHLNDDIEAKPLASLQSCLPLKVDRNSSAASLPFAVDDSVDPGFSAADCTILKSQNQITFRTGRLGPEGFTKDGFSGEESSLQCCSRVRDCGGPAMLDGRECSKMTTREDLTRIEPDVDVTHCSCYAKNTKRKAWEASLSSLKSKKVKGSHQHECETNSTQGASSEIKKCYPAFNLKNSSFVEATPSGIMTLSCTESNAKEDGPISKASEVLCHKELQSKDKCFKVMLMNITDNSKKGHLTKVIETLGGVVTPNGCESTHVVTGKARTTLNFCTALCSGAWIVSSSWLKESFRQGRYMDELPHIFSDEDYLLKYKIELKTAVLRARAKPQALLKGYSICIAAHVNPPVKTLSAIVKSAGGNIISVLDKVSEASKTIFVACEDDMDEALIAAKKGIRTFSSEWLMNCVMRQELDFDAQPFAESL